MYLTIIILPLVSAVVSGLLGRKLGATGSKILSSALIGTTAILGLIAFSEVALSSSALSIHLTNWIDSERILISWGFNFDSLTVSMLLPVLIVSTAVHIYSSGYMEQDPHVQRFFSYLSLFTFFMLILVTGDNLLLIFIGWEGVGICSYLLINFWFRRVQANKAAIKALVMNRIGDWGMSVAMFALIAMTGDLDLTTVFSLAPLMEDNKLSLIAILLLIAAMAKSAQLVLHTWLPDAMEGPTPVSALIHAATMVTAGVYLLLRASPLLEYSSTPLLVITWIGALTAFFGASSALLQNDLKRVIAYSTCSQLGYLVMSVGLSNYSTSLFHLVNHAYFKALLFLSAGAVIHAMNDEQDMRKMGGLVQLLPFTYTNILIGSLSLMALPFLTGFYSKDFILEVAYGRYLFTGGIAYWLGTLTAIITAFYSFRLIALTFLTFPNGTKTNYLHAHEPSMVMSLPLIVLALASILIGYLTKDMFIGLGSHLFSHSLFTHPNHLSVIEAEFAIPFFYLILPVVGSLLGGFFGWFLYEICPGSEQAAAGWQGWRIRAYIFLNQKYHFDNIYNNIIVSFFLNFAFVTHKILDRGAIEFIGPYGLLHFFTRTSRTFARFDTALPIPTHALYIILAFILFLTEIFLIGDPKLIFVILASFALFAAP